MLNGRAVFLAWFKRQDGVAMLVTDIGAPEKIADRVLRPQGRQRRARSPPTLAKNYLAKMASYPAFGPGP